MQEQEQEIQEKLATIYTARSRAQVRFMQAQLRLKEVEARLQALHERLVTRDTLSTPFEEDDLGPENGDLLAFSDLTLRSTAENDEAENDEETQKREIVRISQQKKEKRR